ncbi:hypothetical protein [Streptomyces sp. HGB0020]|uniref:hypothetical protein n=1 Tax=Streptomyces sp. HGB0020 TaxID=1078086 RepID=UPI00034E8E8D|nr:hypothetical protein [Streptomyces sp. HGB0020]EPD56375.1 hypothetical protein HMPREF1211_07495 [Streptomyces sp. HGB0020]
MPDLSARPDAPASHPVDEPLYGTIADRIRDQLREPTDLDVAISIAQQLLNSDQVLSLHEALRLLLRALDAEPVTADEAVRRSVDAQFPAIAAFLAEERGDQA